MGKISAVYKIVNTVTGDFYIGSSVNVMRRWREHRKPSTWKFKANSPLYQDMQEYGLDCFSFEILKEVKLENLRQEEQEFIELLKPTYNDRRAKGLDTERVKSTLREYSQSDKGKARIKKYNQSDKGKARNKKYNQSDKGKARIKKYDNKLCSYNGETLTLSALSRRFYRAGIPHATLEAKKYLV